MDEKKDDVSDNLEVGGKVAKKRVRFSPRIQVRTFTKWNTELPVSNEEKDVPKQKRTRIAITDQYRKQPKVGRKWLALSSDGEEVDLYKVYDQREHAPSVCLVKYYLDKNFITPIINRSISNELIRCGVLAIEDSVPKMFSLHDKLDILRVFHDIIFRKKVFNTIYEKTQLSSALGKTKCIYVEGSVEASIVLDERSMVHLRNMVIEFFYKLHALYDGKGSQVEITHSINTVRQYLSKRGEFDFMEAKLHEKNKESKESGTPEWKIDSWLPGRKRVLHTKLRNKENKAYRMGLCVRFVTNDFDVYSFKYIYENVIAMYPKENEKNTVTQHTIKNECKRLDQLIQKAVKFGAEKGYGASFLAHKITNAFCDDGEIELEYSIQQRLMKHLERKMNLYSHRSKHVELSG